MQNLSTLRTRWADLEAEETRLLREMSIAESLRAFTLLYDAFAPRFREDELDYQAEREAALTEQQCRLRRLADWIKDHPDTQAVGA